MERFVFEVIQPLISKDLEEERRKERVEKVKQELKAFIKGELIPINKQLAKKTRQLFVASSDIQNLKENIEFHQKQAMKLRSEVAARQNDLVKQKMAFQRDTKELQQEIQTQKKQIKRLNKYCQTEVERLNNEWQQKLIDSKRQMRNQYQKRIQTQRKQHQQALEHQKQTFSTEKNHIILQNGKQRSKLIKKYQQKLHNTKNEFEQNIEKLTKQFNQKIDELKKSRGQLYQKLTNEQITNRKLTMELQRQVSQHNRFKSQFQSTFKELENNRDRNQEQRTKFINDYQTLKFNSKEMQKKYTTELRQLQALFNKTVQEKDKKFIDTVQTMSTQHRIELQSLQSNMIEQREIVLSSFEVKAYQQMYQQVKKYEKLQKEFKELQCQYNNVKNHYDQKIKEMEDNHDRQLSNIVERKEYQYELSGENAKREYNNLLNKFNLQVRCLKNQNAIDIENLQKKATQQKIGLSNKLISQYEAMLTDQRSNTEIQIKQKLMEFERKSKGYEKRIAQGQKRKSQLKVVIERMKIQSQMKIESMMEVNQKLQNQIQELHQRILELQKVKSSLINDYQFQLLLVRNEMEKVKEQCRQREDDLRANLNERIVVKNKQIAKFSEKIKQETEQLIKKNKDRMSLIQKQYSQLKRVINQKTSLPEDIEALKVFHAAYLEKQSELISEKRKREELQRQLHSKDAIEKVFASKEAFKRLTVVDKISQNSNNFTKIQGRLQM